MSWSIVSASTLILILTIVVISCVILSLVHRAWVERVILKLWVLVTKTVFGLLFTPLSHRLLFSLLVPRIMRDLPCCIRSIHFCLIVLTASSATPFTAGWHVAGWSVLWVLRLVLSVVLFSFRINSLLSSFADIVVNWLAIAASSAAPTPTRLLAIILRVLDKIIWLVVFILMKLRRFLLLLF